MTEKLKQARDIRIAEQAAGALHSPATFMSDLAGQAIDPELREELTRLGFELRDSAQQLHHYAVQRLVAMREEQDKENGNNEDVSHLRLLSVFDLREITDRGAGNIKWYNPFTQTGDTTGDSRNTLKTRVCVHNTAVAGGFGIHGSRKDHWLGYPMTVEPNLRTPNGGMDPGLWRVLQEDMTQEAWAQAMALADRYRGYVPGEYNTGVPYHAVSGANSALYLNLPFKWVTWHGNGSNNTSLGYAWDGHSQKDEITTDGTGAYQAEDLSLDLTYLIEKAREEGHPLEEITCHGCWTNKPNDPGKQYIELVVVPVAEAMGLKIDWDFKTNGGRSMKEMVARG